MAGLRGGTGKTTLSLGLLRAFKAKGLAAVAFKKGPDYIDAGWLSVASGGFCFNLDPYLIGEGNILPSFLRHSGGADISIIEGNRGLFDGMDLEGSQSTSRLATELKSPVVLVLDASKMTRTAAAMVLGVKKFEPALKLAAVVLNQTGGKRHESIMRQSIEHYTGVPVIGALPRKAGLGLSERHMGLVPYQEHPEIEQAIDSAAALVSESVDLERVMKIASQCQSFGAAYAAQKANDEATTRKRSSIYEGLRIGILQDSAFQFYYPENLEALAEAGAELTPLSPLTDMDLPDIDALYIGGGFPETHAIALSRNIGFLKELKNRIEKGLPVYAECGGLMYLGTYIELKSGRYQMAGVFPYGFALESRPVAHGYTSATVSAKNPFYPKGAVLNGHEFHYSRPVRDGAKGPAFALTMKRGAGIENGKDGLIYNNVFATYTHTHALGTPQWAKGLLKAAREYSRGK
ncbi:MAG: cobyrinate a,c-diamide synthase [Actinomycetota bacterium]|nr:cobyrinate a,c-diamide synthase [Nitrospiraceae bacterium]MDA8157145.1 cobyrinate a,c-diamide synthase [Actinomycetota bacterium]